MDTFVVFLRELIEMYLFRNVIESPLKVKKNLLEPTNKTNANSHIIHTVQKVKHSE